MPVVLVLAFVFCVELTRVIVWYASHAPAAEIEAA